MMNALPYSPKLNIPALAAAFDETTNSYKYYWFLTILDLIHDGSGNFIPFNLLVSHILAKAWYPLVYFQLSFGKQDQMDRVISLLKAHHNLQPNTPHQQIVECVLDHLERKDNIGQTINSLLNFVPYRFLRPFFAKNLRGVKDWIINREIRTLAEISFEDSSPCIYRFVAQPINGIEIHPVWMDYINQHTTILRGFCLWQLINYLQRNNPNVPNIAYKLFEPQTRDLHIARNFWSFVLAQAGSVRCIYSGQIIPQENFSLDHFLPWRYVAHDQLWNIIPTFKSINSSKQDSLPDLMYIEPFASLQFQAVQIAARTSKRAWLYDYLTLLQIGSTVELHKIDFATFHETLNRTLLPQMEIASNMGFLVGWRYKSLGKILA